MSDAEVRLRRACPRRDRPIAGRALCLPRTRQKPGHWCRWRWSGRRYRGDSL